MTDLFLWSRALNQNERMVVFQAFDFIGAQYGGLVAAYPMEEGHGREMGDPTNQQPNITLRFGDTPFWTTDVPEAAGW